MNPKSIIKKMSQKKVQDYTFTILFFFIFSFFVLGAIRPNILTAVRLQQELKVLREMDLKYENLLLNIVDNQSILEANRDNFYLLDEAIPSSPQVYKLIDDLKKSASESGLILDSIDVAQIDLKVEEKKSAGLTPFILSMQVEGNLKNTQVFVENLLNQRRLKVIDGLSLQVAGVSESMADGGLKVNMQIEGYHGL